MFKNKIINKEVPTSSWRLELLTTPIFSFLLLAGFNFALAQNEAQIPDQYKDIIEKNQQNLQSGDIKNLLPLSISLDYEPKPVLASSKVKVTSQVLSITQTNGVSYRWFLDNKEIINNNPIFEFNMNENLIRQDLRCGDYREVKAEAINSNTKEKASSTIKIPIGLNLSFNKRTIGVADQNNPEISDFNLHASEISVESIALQVPDIFLKPTATQNQFRYTDIVEVVATDLRNTYNNQACSSAANFTNLDAYLNSLTYNWQFDGVNQETKSGKGENFRKANFIINSLPAQTIQNDLTACNNNQSQNSDIVNLTVSDSLGQVLAVKEESLDVIAPQINIKPKCDAFGKNIQCLNLNSTNFKSISNIPQSYQLNSGQEAIFQANLSNFLPSQKLEIIWKSNDQIIDNKTITNPNTPFYASPTIKMANQEQIITVEATNFVYNSSQKEQASQTILLTPNPERAGISTSGTLGSLSKFIPKNFKDLSNFIGIAGLLGVAILLFTVYEKKKQ